MFHLLRLGSLATLLLAPLSLAAGPSSLTVNDTRSIPNQFGDIYGITPSCSACHGINSSVKPNAFADATAYGKALDSAMNFDSTPPSNPLSNADAQKILDALYAVEPDYAPFVSAVAGTSFAGGNITLDAGLTSATITIDPGDTYLDTPVTLTAVNPVDRPGANDLSAFVSGGPTSTVSVSLGHISALSRGINRRAGNPFELELAPANDAGFKPVSSTMVARNTILITFRNVDPVAVADGLPGGLNPTSANDATNPFVIDVLDNDSDADSDNSTLTIVQASGLTGGAADGTLTFLSDRVEYVPPVPLPTTARTTEFTYRAVDTEGGQSAATTVRILIPASAPASTPPVLQDDTFTMDEDDVLTGNVTADNGNGVDADPDGLGTVTFTVTSGPSRGTLVMSNNGSFTYTPRDDDTGVVSFTYQGFDGTNTDTATATITIDPVNDPPAAAPITLAARTEAEPDLTIDLLDAAFVSDVDGDTLSVRNFSASITSPVTVRNADAFSRSGRTLTISPLAFGDLDDGDIATLTFTYDIDDGSSALVSNQAELQIIGLENGLGRLAGQYADTISGRYNGHFGPTAAANASCHTCHNPGQVDADVDTVDECRQTPRVFNTYGLQLCLNRDASQPALSDLIRRMREAEADFAPVLPPVERLTVAEGSAPGTPVGDPLVADPGRTVDGDPSSIVTYLLKVDGQGAPQTVDATGQFTVGDDGQVRVASGAVLTPGIYPLVVLPVNDAGQKDNAGNLRKGVPGFYPVEPENQTTISVEVISISPVAVDDTVFALEGTDLRIDVTGNDGGGAADRVNIVTAAARGATRVNGDLSVTYTPDPGFTGTDSFTYVSSNDAGASDPAEVQITVLPAGNVVAIDDSAATTSGATVRVDVLENDLGALRTGGQRTQVQVVAGSDAADVGTLQVVGQVIEFTPAADFVGETTARYRAVNPGQAGGVATTASIAITVTRTADDVLSARLADPELRKVAAALEESCRITGDAAMLAACGHLIAGANNGEDLTAAMRALRNEEHLAAVGVAMAQVRQIGRGLQRRIDTLGTDASTGLDLAGLSLSLDGQVVPTQLVSDFLKGLAGLAPDEGWQNASFGVFVAGEVSFATEDATDTREDTETLSGNILIGVDRSIDDLRQVGLALGVAQGVTDFGGGGTLDATSLQLSVYGRALSASRPGLSYGGHASYGRIWFDLDRAIAFTINDTAFDTVASSSFEASFVNVAPHLAYKQIVTHPNPWLNGAGLRWKLGLDYMRLSVDGYTETGGEGLALTVAPGSFASLQAVVGADLRQNVLLMGQTPAELRMGLSLSSELLDDARTVTSSFAAAGPDAPVFEVTEDGTAGTDGTVTLGLTWPTGQGELALDYDYDLGSSGRRAHALALGYRHEFSRDRGNLELGLSNQIATRAANSVSANALYRLDF